MQHAAQTGRHFLVQHRLECRLFKQLGENGVLQRVQGAFSGDALGCGTFVLRCQPNLDFAHLIGIEHAHGDRIGSLIGQVAAHPRADFFGSLSDVNGFAIVVKKRVNAGLKRANAALHLLFRIGVEIGHFVIEKQYQLLAQFSGFERQLGCRITDDDGERLGPAGFFGSGHELRRAPKRLLLVRGNDGVEQMLAQMTHHIHHHPIAAHVIGVAVVRRQNIGLR